MGKSNKRWLPLESNPEVMTTFLGQLGVDTSKWAFCDIFGLDQELLAMVPQPVLAVLMLFPITDETEKARQKEEDQISESGQRLSSDVWFTKQTVGNACGTIGLIHAVANNTDRINIGVQLA
uniref:Ubiquitin carboxyl-terminal hydrolase n=1 Tax=Tetraselmis sp. GSL018 TaxID=582737 RepID=A0A061SEX6_9CHLO